MLRPPDAWYYLVDIDEQGMRLVEDEQSATKHHPDMLPLVLRVMLILSQMESPSYPAGGVSAPANR
jgi:hypothetical protein